MKKLAADLKNGIKKNIYLLHGPQAYLRNQYRDRLVKTFSAGDDGLNYAHFEGSEADLSEIISLADTVPFLAEYRVIVAENTGFFSKANDELAAYIPQIPDTTVLIFSEEAIDGRLKSVTAVKQKGCVADFADLSSDDLKRWVVSKLSAAGVPITGQALEMFIAGCGSDMIFVQSELEKLISYTMGRDGIYPKDVEAICTVQIEDKIFMMLDAMFRHDSTETFKYYSDLVALHTEPANTLALIESQLRLLLHIRQMDGEHLGTKQMASALSMNEYRVKKALPQARKSSKIWIMDGLDFCAQIDEDYKSGRINPRIGLEMVITHLSSKA